jgi:hypothetical protein
MLASLLVAPTSAQAAEEWVARYDGPAKGDDLDSPDKDDLATALSVDAAGNVYVTGLSSGSGTSVDYATLKYDTAGNLQWVARYDGYANALSVDAAGNVYVTGESYGSGSGYDYATIKYPPLQQEAGLEPLVVDSDAAEVNLSFAPGQSVRLMCKAEIGQKIWVLLQLPRVYWCRSESRPFWTVKK